ncbi:hypothetical protein KM043_014616 [Ampulex compressa]|nr:hypothetical protein KM043_014616 [Ampulex compressa]
MAKRGKRAVGGKEACSDITYRRRTLSRRGRGRRRETPDRPFANNRLEIPQSEGRTGMAYCRRVSISAFRPREPRMRRANSGSAAGHFQRRLDRNWGTLLAEAERREHCPLMNN